MTFVATIVRNTGQVIGYNVDHILSYDYQPNQSLIVNLETGYIRRANMKELEDETVRKEKGDVLSMFTSPMGDVDPYVTLYGSEAEAMYELLKQNSQSLSYGLPNLLPEDKSNG